MTFRDGDRCDAEKGEVVMIEWLRSGEYLPPALRDFHAQKEIFKTLWQQVERRKAVDASTANYLGSLDWVAAQVFAIDHFLHFMASHGWTLQRSRKRVQFRDLDEAVAKRRKEEAEAFRAWMSSQVPAGKEAGT